MNYSCRLLRRAADQRHQRCLGLFLGKGGLGVERTIRHVAVEEVRHQHRITLARQPLGHASERRARTESVLIENDTGLGRGGLGRAEQARLGHAITGLDLKVLLGHCLLRSSEGRYISAQTATARHCLKVAVNISCRIA